MTLKSMETEQSHSSPSVLKNSTSSLDDLQDDRSESPARNGSSPTIDTTEDPDQYEERFRVDRRRLEQMLQCAGSGLSTQAEDFFLKVMESTSTLITWPSKLKIGAKSKKDPHIKVSGDPENVQQAKDKIMSVLDTKTAIDGHVSDELEIIILGTGTVSFKTEEINFVQSNRVTLKMDVAHTEHSHVIGKGGNNIKRVMEDTGCHIHFPDSNRNNQTDKSNQVSIAGKPYGVESARLKIRDLLPVTLSFEIPMNGVTQVQIEQTTPAIMRLQQQYNVTVNLKPRVRGFASTTVVIIRGTVNNSQALKEATQLLMENLTGSCATMLPVSLQLEIAAQHHLFMVGRAGSNIQQIMAKTGASICFPDASTMNSQNKGVILMHGPIDNVLAAREHIMSCLPLVLMFDMKAEIDCDRDTMANIMQKLDVFISIKPKPKQPSKSVIVKSIEENSSNMYEARRILLGLEREEMPSQRIPHLTTVPQPGLINAHNLLNLSNQANPLLLINHRQFSPLSSPRNNAQTSSNGWTINSHPYAVISHNMVQVPTSSLQVPTTSMQHQSGENQALTSAQKSTGDSMIVRDLNQNTRVSAYGTTPSSHSPPHQAQKYPEVSVNGMIGSPGSLIHSNASPNGTPGQSHNAPAGVHTGSSSSILAAQQASAAKHMSQQQQQGQRQQPTVDLDMLTKTLKHDLNLNSSGAHLLDMQAAASMRLHHSGSTSELRAVQQRQQQQQQQQQQQLLNKARSPTPSRRSFSLSMSLSSSKGSLMDMIGDDSGSSQRLGESLRATSYSSKSDLLSLGTGELRNNDRLLNTSSSDLLPPSRTPQFMISANDRMMGLQKERLMSSSGILKPPPGISQPPAGAVNPANIDTALADYERKKVMASRAIEQEPSGEARNPTDFWSGLGFSRSMPDSVIRDRLKANNVRYDGSNMPTAFEREEEGPWMGSEEIVEPINGNRGWSQESADMADLLRNYNLEKYVELFQQQEIDRATFMTLNDQDLREIGIETFGARRKMLLAINDLKNQRPTKYFSPTPGSNNPFRTANSSSPAINGSSFPQPSRSDIISQSGRW